MGQALVYQSRARVAVGGRGARCQRRGARPTPPCWVRPEPRQAAAGPGSAGFASLPTVSRHA
eukprot:2073193-Lingulodinium_polyedra.AAC.1